MSEKLTNSQAVIALLKATPDVAMKPRQIAHELKVLYPEKYGNHAEGALAGQITAQATSWLVKHPELHRSDDPVQFWWGEPQVETETKIGQLHDNLPAEKELYPLLAKFLIGRQRKIYAKRIDEKKSKNANGKHGNHWLYPDMVGMEDLTSGWDFAIKNWTAQAGLRRPGCGPSKSNERLPGPRFDLITSRLSPIPRGPITVTWSLPRSIQKPCQSYVFSMSSMASGSSNSAWMTRWVARRYRSSPESGKPLIGTPAIGLPTRTATFMPFSSSSRSFMPRIRPMRLSGVYCRLSDCSHARPYRARA